MLCTCRDGDAHDARLPTMCLQCTSAESSKGLFSFVLTEHSGSQWLASLSWKWIYASLGRAIVSQIPGARWVELTRVNWRPSTAPLSQAVLDDFVIHRSQKLYIYIYIGLHINIKYRWCVQRVHAELCT